MKDTFFYQISTIKLCEYIPKHYNYNYLSLIPCNIYGPFDKFDERKGHVIGSLILMLQQNKHLKNIQKFGDQEKFVLFNLRR